MTEETKTKPKTVADNMARRAIFANADLASAYLNRLGEELSDFGKIPFAAPGIDAEGNFDPAVYGDGMEIMVSVLKHETKVKAIVVNPVPTLDSLLADQQGIDWIQKIIHKELSHVSMRPLRAAANVVGAVAEMPTTRDDFISETRAGAALLASFDALYKKVGTAFAAAKVKVWQRANLKKAELRKCLESASYAAEYYAALEDRGEDQSLFVVALNLLVKAAEREGLDATIFNRWLDTRNEKVFTADDEDDDASDDFDEDALLASMLADESKADEPAADGEAPAEPDAAVDPVDDSADDATDPVEDGADPA